MSDPPEDGTKRDRNSATEQLRQKMGLIKAAFPFPDRMQRDGDDCVETMTLQSGIIERLTKPAAKWMPQVSAPPIFKFVDQLAHDPATPVSGDGGIKMNGPVGTVGAG